MDSAPLSAALARLSCLQDLKLLCKGWPEGLHGSCLAGIKQLTQLTALKVSSKLSGKRAHLQQQLQQLTQPLLLLRRLHLAIRRLPVLDLAHLSRLEDLVLIDGLIQGTVLPLQLTALALGDCHCGLDVTPLLRLQRLQSLQFRVIAFNSATPLLQLSEALPTLQHLSLRYCDPRDAGEGAQAWPQLPALQELSLEYEFSTPTSSQLEGILRGVAASTRLTQLQLAASVLASEHGDGSKDPAVPAAACARLAGLKNLHELRFSRDSILEPGDALALTALTGLTRLDLQNAGDAVDDTAATALACCLKQLRHLDLQNCDLGSMACLAAVAQLRGLTELRLEGNQGLTERGLMLLTGLSQLQQLGVSSDQLPAAAVTSFWSALRQQQQQQQ